MAIACVTHFRSPGTRAHSPSVLRSAIAVFPSSLVVSVETTIDRGRCKEKEELMTL